MAKEKFKYYPDIDDPHHLNWDIYDVDDQGNETKKKSFKHSRVIPKIEDNSTKDRPTGGKKKKKDD